MALTYTKGIAKDGKVWRCRVVHKGKVFKRTCNTKREAESYVLAVRTGDVDRVAQLTQPQRMVASATALGVTIDELVELFIEPLATARESDCGAKNVRFILERIGERWARRDVSEVTVDEVVEWASDLNLGGRKGSTVAKYLDELHRLLNSARARRKLPSTFLSPVPAAREVLRKGAEKIISNGDETGRRVEQWEIDELCEVILAGRAGCAPKPELAHFIHFAVASGFRSTEICRLTWGDIDWDTHTVVVRNLKSGKKDQRETRVAPMTPEMESVLAEALPQDRTVYDSDPVFPRTTKGGNISAANPFNDNQSVYTAIQKARAHTNVPHLRVHDFRHEGLSRLGDMLIPGIGYLNALQIQQFSGHKTLDMVQRYVKADVNTFAAQLHEALGPKATGKVVKFPRRKRA